ncbi:MAG: hypothetical protein M1820_005242 [Bogoriella megaspora]|nr:MAG: hypothetical protein M1820_005242 [Bogoriella megaspora]
MPPSFDNEKGPISVGADIMSSSAKATHEQDSDTDLAYEYLVQNHNVNDAGAINLKVLRRRIDWHIMPIMSALYTMTFIDKILINYAAVMGLNKDLKLKGDEFSNASSAFSIAYLVAGVLNGLVINKVPAAKWLAINVVLWGITSASMAATHNYVTLVVARVFLGLFEASISPCLTLLVAQWYTKDEQAPRISFWYSGLSFGQIFGGILSYAFQHVHNPSFAGWKALFVFCGALTIIIGAIGFLIIPESPMAAKFVNDAEKVAILQHVSVNKTGVLNNHVKLSHLIEMGLDLQIWLMIVCTVSISVTSGVISTYSATLITSFGYTPPIAALLNTPSGLVSFISIMGAGFGVRHNGNRWFWLVLCCIPGIIGGALMAFLPRNNQAGLLAGIYLVNAIVSTLPTIYSWASANVAGHTKRTCTLSLLNAAYSAGSIIGPQTFRAKDAPHYYPAMISVLGTQAGGAIIALLLLGYYNLANRRKDRLVGAVSDSGSEDGAMSQEKWANITDKQNPTFRYVY